MTKLIAFKTSLLEFCFKHGRLSRLIFGVTMAILLTGCAEENTNTKEPLEDRPNVLLIIVDDLKPMLNAYGESQIITPNIDSLASESAVFTNAHCQQSICSPSRISFLTGMRPDYTRIWDLKTLREERIPDLLTLPQYFKNNGYETIGLGKVFHNMEDNEGDLWTRPFFKRKDLKYSSDYPIPVFHNKYQNRKTKLVYDKNSDKNSSEIEEALLKGNALPSTENEDVADDSYVDGAVTIKSIQLLKELAEDANPFFMAVGFKKPHLPFIAPRKYWDLYDRDNIELAPFQKRSKGAHAIGYHRSIELWGYSDIQMQSDSVGIVGIDKQGELIHGYYACVSYIDAQIGLLIDYLKVSGLDKNTIVVVMGDHGWHLGDHGLWTKKTNFEQATRTPLIIHSPDMTKSLYNSSPVELLDVFPTISDLAGLDIPKHLQGASLVPILNRETDSVKTFALSQYPRSVHMGYAVRTKRYRYVEWHKREPIINGIYAESNILTSELYDYEADPLERKNLVKEKKYAQVRANLKEMLKGSFVKNGK